MAYGELIRRKRQRLGLTQRQLAGRVGATDGYISHLEKEVRIPSPEFAIALARAFELSEAERNDFLQAIEQARTEGARQQSSAGAGAAAFFRASDDAATEPGLRVLDLEGDGEPRAIFLEAAPRCLGLGPGGLLITGSGEGELIIWDEAGQQTKLDAHEGPIHAVAWAPDGAIVASGGGDGALRLWRWPEGTERCTVSERGTVTALAFSPDGELVAGAREDGTVRIWDVESGSHRGSIATQAGAVRALAFSPDGAMLASANGGVALWNVRDGQLVRALRGLGRNATALAFSPDGGQLAASGPAHDRVQLWELSDGGDSYSLPVSRQGVAAIAFGQEPGALVTLSRDGALAYWDLGTGRRTRSLRVDLESVHLASVAPGQTSLAAAGIQRAEGLAIEAERVAAELERDPLLRSAWHDFLAAYSRPELREAVVSTLRGLAQAADSA